MLCFPIFVLASCSAIAQSEWVRISSDDISTYYVRKNSITGNGKHVQMVTLTDYKRARSFDGGKPTQSIAKQSEYDCSGLRLRNLRGSAFSGAMGTGNINDTGEFDQKWLTIVPGSIGELQWKIACGS